MNQVPAAYAYMTKAFLPIIPPILPSAYLSLLILCKAS